MRITTLFTKKTPTDTPACCATGLVHCHETLVLHADGTLECDGEAFCAAESLQHELWVACDQLGCGCMGDDAPLEGWLVAA
jgi:hypothetical protein